MESNWIRIKQDVLYIAYSFLLKGGKPQNSLETQYIPLHVAFSMSYQVPIAFA